MRIEEIDPNFAAIEFPAEGVKFYDARKAPFRLYGLYQPETETVFRRLPTDVAEATNMGVARLATHTAGGRVRFKTNSPFVAIRADMPVTQLMSHMPCTGQAGFSMYFNKNGRSTYYRTFFPAPTWLVEGKGLTSIIRFDDTPKEDIRDITIYFPLYAAVNTLYIGLSEDAVVLEGEPYGREKPVVFYGSSITQGGCASRPGNSYQGFLSRRFDFDFINLGFSGSARGEEAITAYIAGLDMSMFVYDYDHNAPNAEHLKNTHEKMFRAIRCAHPDLPVIFMSAPNLDANRDVYAARRAVVFETYARVEAEGDKNVYYVDGERLFGGDCRDACTVDGCHPNDLGFYRMADMVGATMEIIYSREGCR